MIEEELAIMPKVIATGEVICEIALVEGVDVVEGVTIFEIAERRGNLIYLGLKDLPDRPSDGIVEKTTTPLWTINPSELDFRRTLRRAARFLQAS